MRKEGELMEDWRQVVRGTPSANRWRTDGGWRAGVRDSVRGMREDSLSRIMCRSGQVAEVNVYCRGMSRGSRYSAKDRWGIMGRGEVWETAGGVKKRWVVMD
jgi:hypothetical protein